MKEEGKPKGCRAALYARVSSDQQAQQGTIDSQLSLLRERLAADGGVVDAGLSFIDDGVSGSTLLRPALERLRDQAAAGAIDRLYVLAPDRLARRHAHQMVLVEELQACGVEVVFLNRALGTTPEDQLLLQVQGIIGEYERAKILERTRRGRLHAARCGRVSVMVRAPFGYRYIDKHSGGGVAAYEVIPEEAAIVRQIFAWMGHEGCSLNTIVRRLDEAGVRTRHGQKRWSRPTVWGMLKNPTYQGQAAFGRKRMGEPRPRLRPRRGQAEVPKRPLQSIYLQPASEHIHIPVPAIVDADLFQAVQERLEENRRRLRQRRRGSQFLLSGLAVCGCCGYAVYGQRAGGRPYYRCLGRDRRRFGGQPVCQNRTQHATDLEAAVWDDVRALLSEPDRLRQEFERRQQRSAMNPATDESARLRTAILKIKQGISRLIDAYSAGLLESDEFEPRIRRLKERRAKLEGDLQQHDEQLRADQEVRLVLNRFEEFADQIKGGLNTADFSQRQAILRALVKRIEIHAQDIRMVYKVTPRPFAKGPLGGQVRDCLSSDRQSSWGNASHRKATPGIV
jgi:site-specific DNA recombinase